MFIYVYLCLFICFYLCSFYLYSFYLRLRFGRTLILPFCVGSWIVSRVIREEPIEILRVITEKPIEPFGRGSRVMVVEPIWSFYGCSVEKES